MMQRDVAQALGIVQSLVSDIEGGRRRLDLAELKTLATLYGKPLTWFLD